ncbi:MAG: hypothetical protein CL678_09385 [Bdellovibrionaceae bacterium]|nr:hypothetical protein [Pseudobdellovibrionaceae bacterium]|tara:strand:+ start:728 stop:988 length:261 start_codon:yes stop_codon:yes gene_type:complete
MSVTTYEISTICTQYGLEEEQVLEWIELEIIHPFNLEDLLFDQEDFQRIGLICELKNSYGSNSESIQMILHLIDQIHYLQRRLEEK